MLRVHAYLLKSEKYHWNIFVLGKEKGFEQVEESVNVNKTIFHYLRSTVGFFEKKDISVFERI